MEDGDSRFYKTVIIILLIAGIPLVAFSYHAGYTHKLLTQVADAKQVAKYPGTLAAEMPTIKKAADRNKCFGEDFLILLAIRKAENGRKSYLQEKQLTATRNLVQYNKTKGFSWTRSVPNVAKLNQKTTFIKGGGNAKNVSEPSTKSTMLNKTSTLYLPVEKNIMPIIERLFSQLNEKNTGEIGNHIWSVLVSNGKNMAPEYISMSNEDTKSSNKQYMCYSSLAGVENVKVVDMIKTMRPYIGIIKTLQRRNSILNVSGLLLRDSESFTKKLLNASCCVLIVMPNTTSHTSLQTQLLSHRLSNLSVYRNYVQITVFCETGNRQFGVMHPTALDTDLETQAAWAAATIVKNRARWVKEVFPAHRGRGKRARADASGPDFIDFLGDRYCPASVDPVGNKNWKKNVHFWFDKFKRLK